MKTGFWRVGASTLAVVTVITSCGGGGPGVEGPEAQSLFRSYSGMWVLDRDASDEASSAEQPGARGRGGNDPFGGIGGRSGGGVGGDRGGFGGRGRFGPGGGGNPEAMQATMALARTRPTSIQLELNDSTLVAVYVRGRRTEVPMDGSEVELELVAWPTKAKVEWDDLQPRIRWRLEDGGDVTDHFELVSDDRLLVTRVFNMGFGGGVEVHFAYDRQTERS